MAGQDLLDKRRTGARQTDDKDRVGRVGSALALSKAFGRERLNAPVDNGCYRPCEIRVALEAQCVRFRIVGEGLITAAGIVQRLAKGEVEVEPVLITQPR